MGGDPLGGEDRPVSGRLIRAAGVFLILASAGVALAAELPVESGDRVTGTIGTPGEIQVLRIEVPAGATLKAKVKAGKGSALLPRLLLRDPGGADRSNEFAPRVKKKGVSLLAPQLGPGGTWSLEVTGAENSVGTWSLSLALKPRKRFGGEVNVAAGGEGALAFAVLGGSSLKIQLRALDGAGTSELVSIDDPVGEPLALGGARVSVRGSRLKASELEATVTGTHDLRFALLGGRGGRILAKVRVKPPKPRKARLVHPGGEAPGALAIATVALAPGTVGTPYSGAVAARGGTPPYTFLISAGALPPGMALDPDGGFSGSPSAEGNHAFTVEVTDSAAPPATATRALSIEVLAASGSPRWSLLSPTGTAPAGRSSAGFVHDAKNGRMIVALGSTGSSTFPPVHSDSFALTLGGSPSWSALGAGPKARWGPSLVFDSSRNRAILYGGNVDGFQTNGEVWSLHLSTPSGGWTQLSPGGAPPPARLSHAAVYDAGNDRMIVFGGGSGTVPGLNPRSDLWELSFSTSASGAWTERTPASSPPAREFAPAVYDAANERLVLFGGMTIGKQFGDTWALDVSTPGSEAWSQILPSGAAPAARDSHTAVLDTVRQRMVVFGGRVSFADTVEVWALGLTAGAESWARLTPAGGPPAARDSHSAVYDPVGRRMIVFSGFSGFPSTPFTDIWELTLP